MAKATKTIANNFLKLEELENRSIFRFFFVLMGFLRVCFICLFVDEVIELETNFIECLFNNSGGDYVKAIIIFSTLYWRLLSVLIND